MHRVAVRLCSSFSAASFKKLQQFNCFNNSFANLRSYTPNSQRRCFSDWSPEKLSNSADSDTSETDEFNFESDNDTKEVDFDKIAGGDPELVKFLKVTQLEMEMMRQNGQKAPERLKVSHWERLLKMRDSKSQRYKFIQYLWLIEVKTRHHKERQAITAKIFEEKKRQILAQEPIKVTTSTPLLYGLALTTIFHRIYDTQINRYYNQKLMSACQFSPHILLDFSYENYMSEKDLSMTVKQSLYAWSENRDHLNPSHLIFCNLKQDSELRKRLVKLFPTSQEPDFPLFMTDRSYLDMYPKERLVYLTPHCQEVLTKYNPDDIYIIGALVDISKNNPLSLAKAKKEGLRMAKFPIDQCVHWGIGTKSLTLNHCLSILNDVKDGCSWTNAFIRHLPRRKVLGEKFTYQISDDKQETNSTKLIREQYRRNLVYDLIMQQRMKKDKSNDACVDAKEISSPS